MRSDDGSGDGEEDGGDKACDHQRETADGTGQLAELIGFGSADDMGGGAVSHALGDLTADAEDAAEQRACDVAENAGDNDDGGGDGHQAAGHLSQRRTDGRGDGLGKQRHHQRTIIAQQQTPNRYEHQADDRTGGDAGQNGGEIFLQHGKVLIHGDGQAHGGWGQKPAHDAHAGLIVLVLHAGQPEKHQHQHHGDQHGIADGGAQLLLQQHADAITTQSKQHGQNGDLQVFSHAAHHPFG